MLSKLKTAPAVRYADNLSYQINICAGFQFSCFCQPYFPLGQSRALDGDVTFALPMKWHVCLSAAVKEPGACETQAKLNIQNCFILVCKDTIDSYRISKFKILNTRLSTWQHITASPSWLGFFLKPEQTRGTKTGAFRN